MDMKMSFKKVVAGAMLLFATVGAQAHDFVSTLKGQTLYFAITDTTALTAEVTYKGSAVNASAEKDYRGVIEIPVSVKVNGKSYRITGIGAKAFSNATSLEGVTIPSGLTQIGDFAFEGCTSLRKVIFPGNPVTFGDGVFFRCEAIENVTLGSDWQSVDLNRFRWSKNLTELYIPAKMRSLHNMKSLKALKSITVDSNNPYYKSKDGMLYSRDGLTLLGVPRAYENDVVVADGVENIMRGAIADCLQVKNVELPSSVKTLWFAEFARLERLETVSFHSVEPMLTASVNGEEVTVIAIANQKLEVRVPKSGEKAWKKAMVKADGEYAALEGSAANAEQRVPVKVRETEMAGSKNVKGMKSLNVLKVK